MANSIDWNFLENKVVPFYSEEGRPLSDESVCERWVENPYYQYFCGEEYFQHTFPIERSLMTYFRHRVGEDFCIALLQESLNTAHQLGALETKNLEKVVVDTTVQEKAITFPTDAKLRYKAIVSLVKFGKESGITLRQSYLRVGKTAVVKSGRYCHAKQMRRAKKVEKKLQIWLGRIIREIERKKAILIHQQQKSDTRNCILGMRLKLSVLAKVKLISPMNLGVKYRLRQMLILRLLVILFYIQKLFMVDRYDGHTLNVVINEYQAQIGIKPKRIYVDKGYQGHHYEQKDHVFKS